MKHFKEHIKYITDNYEICKINEIPTNRFCISLSIDDGYKCILIQYNSFVIMIFM